jgi:hypothetical protein
MISLEKRLQDNMLQFVWTSFSQCQYEYERINYQLHVPPMLIQVRILGSIRKMSSLIQKLTVFRIPNGTKIVSKVLQGIW